LPVAAGVQAIFGYDSALLEQDFTSVVKIYRAVFPAAG
jgi:hypothetical protein